MFHRLRTQNRRQATHTSSILAEVLEQRQLFTNALSAPTLFTTPPPNIEDQVIAPADTLQITVDPSVVLVTNTDDGGSGSLRWAIEQANSMPGPNSIRFALQDSGSNTFEDVDEKLPGGDRDADVFVIRPLTTLPSLTDRTGGTFIDGASQPGETNPFGPEVVLDGRDIADVAGAGLTLWLGADGNRIEGLNIQSFPGDGIFIVRSDNNVIAGNYIGTDATGREARPNGHTSARASGGITISAGAQGNLIGTDADGVSDVDERNVISGNNRHGIRFQRGTLSDETKDNLVRGNSIGTERFGRALDGLGNLGPGILFVGDTSQSGVFDNTITQNSIAQNTRGNVLHELLAGDANSVYDNTGAALNAELYGRVLAVNGSDGPDNIIVFQIGQTVTVRDASLGITIAQVSVTLFDQIVIHSGDGDDYVDIQKDSIRFAATVNGGAGNDTLLGGAGNDALYGDSGNDEVLGRGGNDVLSGGEGQDLLIGGDGSDRIYGGSENDYILGGDGNDRIYPGFGNDEVRGESGDDLVVDKYGDNTIDAGSGHDRVFGGNGNDIILAGSGNDTVFGAGGSDQILGESGNDRIYAQSGKDVVDGGSGADRIYGGADDDVLRGGSGADVIYGQPGNDWLEGLAGFDWLSGGSGNDAIFGNEHYDMLYGGTGDDWLEGGAWADYLDSGSGDDVEIPGTHLQPTLGTLQQELSWGDLAPWNLIGGVSKWVVDRVEQIGRRVVGYLENLPNRLGRLGENFATAIVGTFTNLPWKKEFWNGWGKLAISGLEIGGFTEAWETAFDILKPWTRGLTHDEIAVARKVFGDSIDYDRVRIDSLTFIKPGEVYVTGYTINYSGGILDDALIHELTHVWQFEHHGLIYLPEAIVGQNSDAGYNFGGIAALSAAKAANRNIFSFNREQQGEIVRAYFLQREVIAANPSGFSAASHERQDLATYAHFVTPLSTLSYSVLAGLEGHLAS